MPRKGSKAGLQEPRVAPQPEKSVGRVVERPDGFYWEKASGEVVGPYTSLAEAEADLLADGAADDLEGGETLQEAESELGIAEWIDPDTGDPAEDNVPRLEDH